MSWAQMHCKERERTPSQAAITEVQLPVNAQQQVRPPPYAEVSAVRCGDAVFGSAVGSRPAYTTFLLIRMSSFATASSRQVHT
jgi:hypothetical protein